MAASAGAGALSAAPALRLHCTLPGCECTAGSTAFGGILKAHTCRSCGHLRGAHDRVSDEQLQALQAQAQELLAEGKLRCLCRSGCAGTRSQSAPQLCFNPSFYR